MNARIDMALSEIYDRESPRLATVDYIAEHGIDINKVAGFCGSPTVLPITLLPNERFDLPDHGAEAAAGVVIEAIDADGDTVIDLVAWPVADPTDVHTLLGQSPMVGLWAAFNAATYTFDYPLIMRRTPLDWLKADCDGAAIIIPSLAARAFLDLPGRIGAADLAHQRELKGLLHEMIRAVEIVSPKPIRRAA